MEDPDCPQRRVIRAAQSQTAALPGERMAARLSAELAEHVLTLTQQIEHTETLIEDRFARHELAEVITSMLGIGTLLGAEFLAATGGDMTVFASADHLAGYAGLAPRPRDSGRISGNRHRPRRYNRDLNRVLDERPSPLMPSLLGLSWGDGGRDDQASTSTTDLARPFGAAIPEPDAPSEAFFGIRRSTPFGSRC